MLYPQTLSWGGLYHSEDSSYQLLHIMGVGKAIMGMEQEGRGDGKFWEWIKGGKE